MISIFTTYIKEVKVYSNSFLNRGFRIKSQMSEVLSIAS